MTNILLFWYNMYVCVCVVETTTYAFITILYYVSIKYDLPDYTKRKRYNMQLRKRSTKLDIIRRAVGVFPRSPAVIVVTTGLVQQFVYCVVGLSPYTGVAVISIRYTAVSARYIPGLRYKPFYRYTVFPFSPPHKITLLYNEDLVI